MKPRKQRMLALGLSAIGLISAAILTFKAFDENMMFFINITDAELDNTTYESAENKFLANDVPKAIEGFKKYMLAFPEGLHALQANFYLAQLLVKTGSEKEAIPNYQYVIDQPQSEYSEQALNKLSQILLEEEEWVIAIPL